MIGQPAHFGVMTAVEHWSAPGIKEGRPWALDNSAFTKGFRPNLFLAKLRALMPYQKTCRFVVCPDAVGDAKLTLQLWAQWYPVLVQYGFPIAFVGQDGLEPVDIPDLCNCFFIGGSTGYKIGPSGRVAAKRAKEMGKWLHVGRVNTWQRILYASLLGADSCDGTCIAFGRDINLARLNRWLEVVNKQRRIF